MHGNPKPQIDLLSAFAAAGEMEVSEYDWMDNTSERLMEQIREREAPLKNLDRLTALPQAFLMRTYFEGSSDPAIAKELDISMTHHHSTRHRAPEQLFRFIVKSEVQDTASQYHSIT